MVSKHGETAFQRFPEYMKGKKLTKKDVFLQLRSELCDDGTGKANNGIETRKHGWFGRRHVWFSTNGVEASTCSTQGNQMHLRYARILSVLWTCYIVLKTASMTSTPFSIFHVTIRVKIILYILIFLLWEKKNNLKKKKN